MDKKTLLGKIILTLFFFNLSSALPALIIVTSPTATDNWTKGSVATIRWTYSGFINPGAQKVIIRLRQDTRVVCNIADDITLTAGSFAWTVGAAPCADIAAGRYYVRVRIEGGEIGDSPEFTIRDFDVMLAPDLALERPNGGEKWEFGKHQTVKWRAARLTQRLNLQLYKDGRYLADIARNCIANNTTARNTGIFSWKVGIDCNGRAHGTGHGFSLRIVTTDGGLSDSCDRTFDISRPVGKGLQAITLTNDRILTGKVSRSDAGSYGWGGNQDPRAGNYWNDLQNTEVKEIGLITYDLSPLPRNIHIESAVLDLSFQFISGDPFGKLGNLMIDAIEFEEITRQLYSRIGVNLYSKTGPPATVDVTERVTLLYVHNVSRFQCKIRFSHPGDGDRQNDWISFTTLRCPLIVRYSRN